MKEKQTVKTIVRQWLIDNGYDGLFCPGECACNLEDLMACDSFCGDCEPGCLGPGNEGYDYTINRTKEAKELMNGCRMTGRYPLCTLDAPEKQRGCKYYEPSRDDLQYCRFTRLPDGDVIDECMCPEAIREAKQEVKK